MTESRTPEIRPAEVSDLLEVFRIERRSFPQPWPYSAFEQSVGSHGFLVAVNGPAVLGYVIADTYVGRTGRIGHLKDLAVHPDHRRQGIGRQLLSRCLNTLAADGARQVKLEVREDNDAAITLYREFGFHAVRRLPRYYADGDTALLMVADLSADRPI